jgi:iron complex outermembrane receptor protein
MRITNLRCSVDLRTARVAPPARASISAAVIFALYGAPYPTYAEEPSELPASTLQEVVVTANRREQTLESVPYSLSVVNSDHIADTGVTDIASLVSQVPGLSMFDLGARASSTVFPIIRGLNASAVSGGFRTFEQAPVGTYIGNSPIDGYFQLEDVQRVEVLRGPQGTLYGAGALGGALRIIPNAPSLGSFSGDLEVSGGTLAHSGGASYTTSGTLNLPVGETLAVRFSGKYAYEPGFIDVYGLLQRSGSSLSGIPVLANPADPVDSSGVFSGKSDWNDQKTFTGRASLLWKPTENFDAQLAFTYSDASGVGGPVADPEFPGGAYPIDPRITFPRGGNYEFFSTTEQPYSTRTTLDSVDLSYDAGFATVSSTSSYFTTSGTQQIDGTYNIFGLPTFVGYYAGSPANPRFVYDDEFGDNAHTFTQEVRLVSNAHADPLFDYVVGVFYENQTRNGSWHIANPGSPERSVAQGCTSPFYNLYDPSGNFIGPAGFPNCLVTSGPGDIFFAQTDQQRFEDKSEFADFTWHFNSRGQITLGGRHFEQSFTDVQTYQDAAFAIDIPAEPHSTPASKNTWKVNPSYEYAIGHYVYALWSQGFRRGGANALPIGGPIGETNPSLLSYAPDTVNNYETGIKGRFAAGLSYTFDVFDIHWDKPQVGGTTPVGNYAVWNANKAESKGLEFDLNAPLLLTGLSISLSGAYAHAIFTKDYFIAADAYGNIVGKSGEQLPGSPKSSAAATINYEHMLAPSYELSLSLNDTYRSAVTITTFPGISGVTPSAPGLNLANCSVAVSHEAWRLGIYVTNVTDKLAFQVPTATTVLSNGLGNPATINQPREINLRLRYWF